MTRIARIAAAVVPVMLAVCVPAFARDASSQRLPFVALESEHDIFAASQLTKTYAPDRTYVLRAPQIRRTDMSRLDRWGWFPANDIPLPEDDEETGRLEQVGSPTPDDVVTEDEMRAGEPAQAGVRVGIPGAVAATGAALGGLVLLVQVLAGLF